MALSIKNPAVEELARKVAAEAGEGLTETIRHSLEERLERLRGTRRVPATVEAILEISRRSAVIPERDSRRDEEILGYDEHGGFDVEW